MHHYTDIGLTIVWLLNGYKLKQTPHGSGISFTNLDGLRTAICLALTRKPSPLTGAEFHYIRSAGMLQSQADFAELLGSSAKDIAHWEKSGEVPLWADKLTRLLYLAHADGKMPIAAAVECINAIDQAEEQPRILLRSTKSGWVSMDDSQSEDEDFID